MTEIADEFPVRRIDGRHLRPLEEPGNDELLSDEVKQRIRLLVAGYEVADQEP